MTLVAAIVVSAIVSLTLTPALCGRFLRAARRAQPAAARSARARSLPRRHAARCTRARSNFSLRHARLIALPPLVLIVATFFLFGAVKAACSRSRTPA